MLVCRKANGWSGFFILPPDFEETADDRTEKLGRTQYDDLHGSYGSSLVVFLNASIMSYNRS